MGQGMFCFQALSVLLGIVYFGQGYDDGNQDGVLSVNGALFLMIMNQTSSTLFPVFTVSSVVGM